MPHHLLVGVTVYDTAPSRDSIRCTSIGMAAGNLWPSLRNEWLHTPNPHDAETNPVQPQPRSMSMYGRSLPPVSNRMSCLWSLHARCFIQVRRLLRIANYLAIWALLEMSLRRFVRIGGHDSPSSYNRSDGTLGIQISSAFPTHPQIVLQGQQDIERRSSRTLFTSSNNTSVSHFDHLGLHNRPSLSTYQTFITSRSQVIAYKERAPLQNILHPTTLQVPPSSAI